MIVTQIRCNTCKTVGAEVNSWPPQCHEIRRNLTKRGWLCLERGGVDLCPACRPPEPQREMFG